MTFEQQFFHWLERNLPTEVPKSVQAFAFNLLDSADADNCTFSVELIGAEIFDIKNPDWACEEVWEPAERQLDIPNDFSGKRWQQCLGKIRSLVLAILQEDSIASRSLKSTRGVGLGFVDGDLEVLWHHS